MANIKSKWVDGPLPLIETAKKTMDVKQHYAVELATEMALVHNMFIRGLNSMFLQGPYVQKEEDVADFFIYCESWILLVEHHHANEEENFFVDLEKLSTDLEQEREQHKQIHGGLHTFMDYVKNTAPKNYKWTDLEAILDSFVKVFSDHLHDEIKTLLALKDSDIPEATLKEAWKRAEKAAINSPLPNMWTMILPFGLGCCDYTYEGGIHGHFPGLPFFIHWPVYLWYGRTYKGAWRFSGSDIWGRPQELPFLKSVQ